MALRCRPCCEQQKGGIREAGRLGIAAARLCATDEDVVDGDVNCVSSLVPLFALLLLLSGTLYVLSLTM